MAKIRTLQIYRGTTAQNNAYTGSAGELTMDTTTNELRLHDGSTVGGHIIGSGGGGSSDYHPDLFDYKWADHICNDVQWLRADTYSWQDGSVYEAAYNHLTADITGKTLQSETISGTTIQFYLADDGHKICPASEESNVTAIYNAIDVAWYYIIDTTNQRFKLPRAKPLTGGVIGNGMTLGLTDSTNNFGLVANINSITYADTGYGTNTGSTWPQPSITSNKTLGITTEAENSGIIAERDNTDQYKYLYFYVGEFTQTALENTAGLNAELFNGKADLNLSNTASNIDFVVERQEPTAANNYTWYRKYKSGWVEQGGMAPISTTSVTFPIEMLDANYYFNSSLTDGGNTGTTHTISGSYTTTGCSLLEGQFNYPGSALTNTAKWYVCGKAAN